MNFITIQNIIKMKIIQNYKPSYKEMFALDIIDPLYFIPLALSVTTGLSLSNWCIIDYSPSRQMAIVIIPMLLALLYHYWVERLTVDHTLVVVPDERSIYYTKASLPKAIIHWIYNLFGHTFSLYLILTFLEPYHPILNATIFLVWLTIPCLIRTYLKGISLDIIKVSFEENEIIWSKAQMKDFMNKYDCDSKKLKE